MNTGRFLLCNTLLLYAAGFAGALLLRGRYRWSLFTFAVFFILFNFNGHITSHLTAGHSMWGGYFLLPFFLLLLPQLAGGRRNAPIKVALLLLVIVLQGSFHLYLWCLLFLLAWAISGKGRLAPGLTAVAWSLGLAAFRLIPAAVAFWGWRDSFLSGYPSIGTLVESLVVLHPPTYRAPGSIFGQPGWWEFDFYIGLIAALFIGYFGVFRTLRRPTKTGYDLLQPFAVPVFLLFVLSLNYFYLLISNLPLPLASVERVTSRFMVLPFAVLLVEACSRLEEVLPLLTRGWPLTLASMAFLQTVSALATHSYLWRLPRGRAESTAAIVTIVQRPDALYTTAVNLSFCGSLLALIVLGIAALLRERNGRAARRAL